MALKSHVCVFAFIFYRTHRKYALGLYVLSTIQYRYSSMPPCSLSISCNSSSIILIIISIHCCLPMSLALVFVLCQLHLLQLLMSKCRCCNNFNIFSNFPHVRYGTKDILIHMYINIPSICVCVCESSQYIMTASCSHA